MPRDPRTFRPNSLAALFLAVTAAGVLSALVAGILHDPSRANYNESFAIGSGFIVAIIFACVGCFSIPRLRNAVIGSICGGLVGVLLGGLASIQPNDLQVLFPAMLGGSFMIVLVGLLGRLSR